MKSKYFKACVFFGLVLTLCAVFTYVLFQHSARFDVESPAGITNDVEAATPFAVFLDSIHHNLAEDGALLLLQIVAILLVSRFFGFLFAKIGQPTVIGEILAGIVLGPSLFGKIAPDAFNFLFSPESLGNIYILSQIGLVLFMFIIGLELDLGSLKSKLGETFVISNSSIVIPFFGGMVLSYFIYEDFAAGQTSFLSFSLFIGISMSITAFPVLARIVQEKGLTRTHLGTISIASAANGDVTAWCLLAAVIAIAKTGSFVSSLYTIACAVVYVALMLLVVRPFLKRIGKIYSNTEVLNKSMIAFFLLVLIASAFITQLIGIHALFGAFLAGVIMPPIPKFRMILIERIEDIAVTLFLPLFFVYTGLNTEIGLVNTPQLWMICGVITLVAIAGKFVGSAVPAKIMGESTRDSLSIGVLMNTRGLMELIVLNIGLEMGILPPTIFVMLVIMTIFTTFITTPVLSVIDKLYSRKRDEEEYQQTQAQGIFRVLISMGNPENGRPMLRVAKSVLDGVKKSLDVTVLHITPGTDTNPMHGEQFADESFEKVKAAARSLKVPIQARYKVTDNVQGGIVRTANYYRFDFLLVGASVSFSEPAKRRYIVRNIKWLNRLIYRFQKRAIFYPGTLIKDKTRYFIENSHCSVGVFVNRNFRSITSTVLFLYDENDVFLFRYARYLLKNSPDVNIVVYDVNNVLQNKILAEPYEALKATYPNRMSKQMKLAAGSLVRNSFMLIAYRTWETLSEMGSDILLSIPSTLIINKKSRKDRPNFDDEYADFDEPVFKEF
ncbi:cation/H(+) antiporter [Paludibacter sp. 221]|uniref:cation:proton antiporter n=1 Tax=Paludibacter sp. 221 TaxID=2302939 RepID=UPI0013D6ECDB|nr:cation:proton antiporter [Paludibacter sp. 221]NDV47936.1 cation/H(+) antiporter [Paludibacter sp. 221]